LSIVVSILNIFDVRTEIKLHNKFKELLGKNINLVIDVGAHKGEFILKYCMKNNIKNAMSFEPNPEIFKILDKKTKDLQNKGILKIFNFGLGTEKTDKILNVNMDSASSSINKLNENSKYFKRKYKILNFMNSKKISKPLKIKILNLDSVLKDSNFKVIDLLKIDTEGYEFNVLKGIGKKLGDIKVIYFEHHFDDMVIKNYKLSDIHNFLKLNNFKKCFKVKMAFRKSFEYIYYNTSLLNL
jgi:FkbM family methyltransferase